MKRNCLLGALFTVVALILSMPWAWTDISNGGNLVLPQMFNLGAGNTSQVIIQNLETSREDVSVEYFAQDGSFVDFISVSIPGLGEAQVATPLEMGGPFVGSAIIRGDGSFAARGQWNFSIRGVPLAVGVPTMHSTEASTTFQMPIGTVGPNSEVGVAIFNTGAGTVNCTVSYRDQAGLAAAENLFNIPVFGQVSQFAAGIGAGFEGSGTVVCSSAVHVTAVIQEQINGFPTPLFASPVL